MIECRFKPLRTSAWAMLRCVAGAAAVVVASTSPVPGLHTTALEQVAAVYESNSYILRVSLKEPDLTDNNIQVVTLNKKGWYHVNPSGAVVLPAGSRVQVAGVFNYAERGLFIEIVLDSAERTGQPINTRPRARIRFLVEAKGDEPDEQAAEAVKLIDKVLKAPSAP